MLDKNNIYQYMELLVRRKKDAADSHTLSQNRVVICVVHLPSPLPHLALLHVLLHIPID